MYVGVIEGSYTEFSPGFVESLFGFIEFILGRVMRVYRGVERGLREFYGEFMVLGVVGLASSPDGPPWGEGELGTPSPM